MHNIRDQQHWHRSLPALPEIAGHLKDILERFLAVGRCVDAATLDDGRLEPLPLPSQVGRSRVAGIDVNRPGMVAVLQAVVALSSIPAGLRSRELAAKIRELTGQSEAEYGPRQASYDLKSCAARAWSSALKSRGVTQRRSRVCGRWPLWGSWRTGAQADPGQGVSSRTPPPASPRKSRPAGESLSGDPRRSPQTVPHTQNLGVETSTTNCRWAANKGLKARPLAV